ncbi:thioredoxin family protein [Salana multivorans]|uniref:thioredoxin family protein n=1 Tax=Salana multivorans TaxID=120377 RepID=UPI0024938159|nr:thioredoxin family protein [Salana multivorans]
MDTETVLGVATLASLLALATVVGLLLRRRDGRRRAVGTGADAPGLGELVPGHELGADPVVVQLSAAVCAPCRATARVWESVAAAGQHVELDVEENLAIVARLHVWRTPTSFVFAPDGSLVIRIDGVPTRQQAREALSSAAPG